MDIEKAKQDFVKNLNEQLNKSGLSRKDLAARLDVPYSTVCAWCNGAIYPRIDKVEKMAKVFGIPKAKLIETYGTVPDGYYYLDKDEQFIIEVFSHSDKKQKELFLAYFEAIKGLMEKEGTYNVNTEETK